jgi:hypothetical protein
MIPCGVTVTIYRSISDGSKLAGGSHCTSIIQIFSLRSGISAASKFRGAPGKAEMKCAKRSSSQ